MTLPNKSVEVGWEALQDEFNKQIEKDKNNKDHDDIFDNLKVAVIEESMKRHNWERRAQEVLVNFSHFFIHVINVINIIIIITESNSTECFRRSFDF